MRTISSPITNATSNSKSPHSCARSRTDRSPVNADRLPGAREPVCFCGARFSKHLCCMHEPPDTRQDIAIEGVALHAGINVHMTLSPAPMGTGVVFRRADLGIDIPARYDAVDGNQSGDGDRQRRGKGRCRRAPDGGGGRRGDRRSSGHARRAGTADPGRRCAVLSRACSNVRNSRTNRSRARRSRSCKRVDVAHKDAGAALLPSDTLEYDFEIEFPTPAIGRQAYAFAFSPKSSARDRAGSHLRLCART